MEQVTIQTRLIDFTDRYVQAEMVMYDKHKTHVKAVLWTRFFHFDFGLGRAITHSEELMELFKSVHMPLPVDRVEQRAKMLARDLKKEVVV